MATSQPYQLPEATLHRLALHHGQREVPLLPLLQRAAGSTEWAARALDDGLTAPAELAAQATTLSAGAHAMLADLAVAKQKLGEPLPSLVSWMLERAGLLARYREPATEEASPRVCAATAPAPLMRAAGRMRARLARWSWCCNWQ